jgi:hypothetical protein
VIVALRLLIYDRTCPRPWFVPGLSQIWGLGRHFYRALGRLDASWGAAGWGEALDWLAAVKPGEPIGEIQFWGHGRWGLARIGAEPLDGSALRPGHVHHERLMRVRDRLAPAGDSLWWFRTCETFGTEVGQGFARDWTRFFQCRAAGHTYVIGAWQSGLHSLRAGEEPTWSSQEGLAPAGEEGAGARVLVSTPGAPNTITFLHGQIPEGF